MRKARASPLSLPLASRELSEDRTRTYIHICNGLRTTRHALPRAHFASVAVHNRAPGHVCGVSTYGGYVPTYGGFGDTWRSHLNFPGEKYVSPAISPSLSHFRHFLRAVSVAPFLFRLSRFSFLTFASVPFCPRLCSPSEPTSVFRERSRAYLADVYVYSAFGGDSCSLATLSCRVHVELSRLRSAETALMDFEILPRLSCTHEIT